MAIGAFPSRIPASNLASRIDDRVDCPRHLLCDLTSDAKTDANVQKGVHRPLDTIARIGGGGICDLPLCLLLIGIALHTHLVRFRLGFHPIGLGVSLRLHQLDLDIRVGFHDLSFLPRFGLGLENTLLLDFQIAFPILFSHPPEIGIVIRSQDRHHIKVRHMKTIFLQRRVDLFGQLFGNLVKMLVDLENIDSFLADNPGQITLDLCDDQRTEHPIHALRGQGIGDIALPESVRRSNQLDEQSSRFFDLQEKFAAGTNIDIESGDGVEQPDLGRRSPFQPGMGDPVDKIDFGMENWISLIYRKPIALPEKWQTLRVERIGTGPERIQSFSVVEKDSFLRFMDDESGSGSEVVERILPGQNIVRPFVFDRQDAVFAIDLGSLDFLLYINLGVTHRTGISCGAGIDVDLAPASRAMNVDKLASRRHIKIVVADRTSCPFGLIIDNGIATMRTDLRDETIFLGVNHVSAFAGDLPRGKQGSGSFMETSAFRTLNQKLQACTFLEEEDVALAAVREYFPALEMGGLLLFAGGQPVGFSLYSRITADTWDIHFEKADHTIKGAPQALTAELAKRLLARGGRLMNREQDMGEPGLRQAKRSLDPCGFVRRVFLKLK